MLMRQEPLRPYGVMSHKMWSHVPTSVDYPAIPASTPLPFRLLHHSHSHFYTTPTPTSISHYPKLRVMAVLLTSELFYPILSQSEAIRAPRSNAIVGSRKDPHSLTSSTTIWPSLLHHFFILVYHEAHYVSITTRNREISTFKKTALT